MTDRPITDARVGPRMVALDDLVAHPLNSNSMPADLQAKYTELLTAMQEARAAYDPFVAGLQGIQKKLDDSLTAASLKEVAPEITRVKEGAKSLKDRIATTLTKLGAVGAIYAQP